jgi:PAS domain S-box-containing protein
VFGLLTLILAGFLIWKQTLHYEKERLLTLSGMLTQAIQEHWSLGVKEPGDMKLLDRKIEPGLEHYPPEFYAGFYSRFPEQVVLLVPHQSKNRLKGFKLLDGEPGRKTWHTLKPQYNFSWSPILKTWVFQWNAPVVVNGQAIGHTFTGVALAGVAQSYLQFEVALFLIILLAGHCAFLSCRWAIRKIQANVNRISSLNDVASPEFDYEEFIQLADQLHRSNQQHRQGEELKSRLAAIVESSNDAIISMDLNGRITSWNQGAERMFGYTQEDMVGELVNLLISMPLKDEIRQYIPKLILNSGSRTMETVLARKDGSLVDAFLTISSIKDKNGEVTGFSGIVQDITEWKQYEKKIYELAAIVESSNEAIVGLSLDGIIINWNPGAAKIFGYSAEEIIGQHVLIITPTELAQETLYIHERVISGQEVETFDSVRIAKNSKIVEVSVQISLIRNKNMTATGIAIIYRDITALKRAETELIEEHERLLVTLNSIGDGVIAADETGKILLMNRVAERLTGWSVVEATGLPLEKVFYIIDDRTSEPYINISGVVFDSGKVLYLNHMILVNRELVEIPVSVSCSPIKPLNDPEILGIVLVFQDITEKQCVEMELLKTVKLESLGILAGGIAHDFNNILAAILANLQLAILKMKKGHDINQYLESTVETVRKASDLTKQLLTFSKGGAPVKKSASIIDLIKDTVDFALRGSNVKAELHFPDELWVVDVDEGQISQVINNLVINAKQAMPKGGMIKINTDNINCGEGGRYQPGAYVKITIQDQGAGIPKEIIDKIFDPFFTTKEKGTGLGLSTSYSIIKQHDGYIEADSQPGHGATFTIHLPATGKVWIRLDSRDQLAPTGEGRLLFMDDEAAIRNLVGEMLNHAGYRVVLAKDGEEVITLYRNALQENDPFDAVIMDLTVPGSMGGQEAIAILREIDLGIKAIVSSGYANDPVMADFEQYGFCGVVTKPYKFNELYEVLTKVIGPNKLPS